MSRNDLLLLGMYVLGFLSACFFNRPLVRRLGKWVQHLESFQSANQTANKVDE